MLIQFAVTSPDRDKPSYSNDCFTKTFFGNVLLMVFVNMELTVLSFQF